MKFAADTNVSVEKSRAELEQILTRFGADCFGYIADKDKAMIQFRANGKNVRFFLPLPDRNAARFTNINAWRVRSESAARQMWEQECRSSWRTLCLCVKAKLAAVDAKIVSFDEEFLAHIILPDGRTAGEMMLPQIDNCYRSGQMPAFTLALPERAIA